MIVKYGSIRRLTTQEKNRYPGFKWVTTDTYRAEVTCKKTNRRFCVTVPRNFLTDGCTMCPGSDEMYGTGWIFHDYLYASHCYTDGTTASRKEADDFFLKIMKHEELHFLRRIGLIITRLNPFRLLTRAWNSSGKRGPIFYST
jgi:hypothetical protein